MSHSIPAEAQRLADRLRHMAEEIESAARYGVPIPTVISVDGYEGSSSVTFSANPDEFTAWAAYTDASVREYDHDGKRWHAAEGNLNGLSASFAAVVCVHNFRTFPGADQGACMNIDCHATAEAVSA